MDMESRAHKKTREKGDEISMIKVREVGTIFVDNRVEERFRLLESGKFEDQQIYKFLKRAIDDLKKDPFVGMPIAHKLIPKEYVKKYDIDNLRKYNLPNGWRLIYTIIGNDVKIISMILEWLNHKSYEKRFKFRVR